MSARSLARLGPLLLTLLVGPAVAQPAVTEVTIPLRVPGLFGARTVSLAATEYRPAGDGPFPAIVLSHGSPPAAQDRPKTTGKFPIASAVFVDWKFVVLTPVRRGYGKTGGGWDEDFGTCANPFYAEAGLETAKDIAAAVGWLAERPYVDHRRLVLVGHSAGGWGSLAAASRRDVPILGVVNFAGGRGGKQRNQANNNCAPERLAAAAGRLAKTTSAPSLWLYAENDQFFAPDLSRHMYEADVAGGGHASYHRLAAIGADGHGLINMRAGVPLWKETVEAFLRDIGALPR